MKSNKRNKGYHETNFDGELKSTTYILNSKFDSFYLDPIIVRFFFSVFASLMNLVDLLFDKEVHKWRKIPTKLTTFGCQLCPFNDIWLHLLIRAIHVMNFLQIFRIDLQLVSVNKLPYFNITGTSSWGSAGCDCSVYRGALELEFQFCVKWKFDRT